MGKHSESQLNVRATLETRAIMYVLSKEQGVSQATILEALALNAFDRSKPRIKGAMRMYNHRAKAKNVGAL